MAGPQRPQRPARRPVVPGVPGQLAAPVPLAGRTQGAQRRVVLHHEHPPRPRCPLRQRAVGEVQVQGPYDVQSGGVGEQPELGAGTRVEVEQVIAARRAAAPEVEVEDAPVAQLRGDPLGERLHSRVRRPAAHRRQTGAARPGPGLAAGAARPDRAGAVGVPVEEPVPVGTRRQERLEQQPAARLLGPPVQLPGLPRRAHQHRAAQPAARGHQPGPAPLRHHRQAQPPRRPRRLRRAVRDQGLGVRDVQGGAHTGQFRLVGHARGQLTRLVGQQIRGLQFRPRPAHRHGARVVHRNQHRGPREPRGEAAQDRRDLGGRRARRRRGVQPAQVTGGADRALCAVGDHVHVHPRAAERTHGAQRSVVKGIPVDPQQNGGDTGVEQRHGRLPSDREGVHRCGRSTHSKAVTAVA
ncbi:hypothetical protein BZZ08_07368 [Streptomyces sp. MH60]|nr:hypothetical protein BZZ08_07368 [Streptomyces sp. MH60]